MQLNINKIALIGPESAGKSTLCAALAERYHTAWVPEYARAYIESLNRKYTIEDVERCTREQLRSEESALKAAKRFLFCDTELINAKVWCLDVFKTVPGWIEAEIPKHRYDLFLLTLPDLEFKEDPVRENPHRRDFFFNWYRSELERYGFPFEIIKGKGIGRLECAAAALRRHFPEHASG